MIIYNVTISINPQIEDTALAWLRETHIPEVMNTGCFLSNNMFKIIENHTERTHNSYAIQYTLESWEQFEEYTAKYASDLQLKTKQKFGENVLAFRTFLEKI
jgi:hypothetical protein